MAGLARANQPVKNPPPSSDFFREYPGRVWGEWGPMMASASGLPPFLCVATTGAGEVEPKISSTSCERGAWRASVPLKHAPRGRSVEVLDLRAVSAHSGRAGGRTGRQREWQGWQGGTTLSLTTCCVLMAYGGSSGLSFFEGGGCGQACGGQNGAGRQRAAAWKRSSVGQQHAAYALQLTITFIAFRRVPSIAGPDFSVPLEQETAKLHTGFVSESSKFFSLSYNKKANSVQY